ncbi:MAG: polyphenol oxidase family protein [Gemmatimonas sp.]
MSGGEMVGEDAPPLASAEPVAGMPAGVLGWTTGREAGSFGLGSEEPVRSTMFRWNALFDELAAQGVHRVASATQVHGADVVRHGSGWRGWLRLRGVDGHISAEPGTALVVTVADCTPVFLAHPSGVVAALHAGWRGTAAGILGAGLEAMAHLGCPAQECTVHLGPAICGACYEVGPEVFEAVTGTRPASKGLLDVRAVLADQAASRGVRELTISPRCTRCDQARFFSHRGGDEGRQLGVIALLPTPAAV